MTWKKKQALIRRETPSLSIPKTVVRVCVCLLLYSIIIPNDVLLLSSSFFSFHGVSTRPIYVATLIALIIWHERRKDINRKTKLKKNKQKTTKKYAKKQTKTNKQNNDRYIHNYIYFAWRWCRCTPPPLHHTFFFSRAAFRFELNSRPKRKRKQGNNKHPISKMIILTNFEE
jgi:K+ transporter